MCLLLFLDAGSLLPSSPRPNQSTSYEVRGNPTCPHPIFHHPTQPWFLVVLRPSHQHAGGIAQRKKQQATHDRVCRSKIRPFSSEGRGPYPRGWVDSIGQPHHRLPRIHALASITDPLCEWASFLSFAHFGKAWLDDFLFRVCAHSTCCFSNPSTFLFGSFILFSSPGLAQARCSRALLSDDPAIATSIEAFPFHTPRPAKTPTLLLLPLAWVSPHQPWLTNCG